MALEKLIGYLDENDKKYVIIQHSPAYTAMEIAASAHVPGKEMVKTVIIKADGILTMVVLPSTHDVDLEAVKSILDAEEVELATEPEFEDRFPDCELGAMPPFGHLFGMETLVAEELTKDKEIAFNAGSHKELVKMSYEDFEELAEPQIVHLAVANA